MFNKIQKSILKNNYDDNSKGKEGGKKKFECNKNLFSSAFKKYFKHKKLF